MFFFSRTAPVPASLNNPAAATETTAAKLGKVATALGLAGNAAALLRGLGGRRVMLSVPTLGLVAAIGVFAAMKIAKNAKAQKATEKELSSYPEGAIGQEPTPELKPYIAEGR